jgi:hypothetical protein
VGVGWDYALNFENFYSTSSITRMIKSTRIRWGGHLEWMGDKRDAYRVLVGKL